MSQKMNILIKTHKGFVRNENGLQPAVLTIYCNGVCIVSWKNEFFEAQLQKPNGVIYNLGKNRFNFDRFILAE